jgi:hypothetical protein
LGIARGSTNAATGSCPALSDVALPPGSYALTANYPSDGNYQRSVSSAQPLTVTTTLLTTGAFPQPAATCGDPGGAAFICALYQAALGRTADPSGLSIYQAQLTAGTSRRAVAEELLTSTEYRRDLVASYYQQYLGRPADAGGIATFVNMFTQGADAESVQAAIIASAEFADRSGGSDSGFVAALYQDLLNRPVDAGGLATFAEQLATGISRTAVAEELLTSAEYRSDLVASYSQSYLGRPADGGGITTFLAQFAPGASNDAVQAALLGSGEVLHRVELRHTRHAGATSHDGHGISGPGAPLDDVSGRDPADAFPETASVHFVPGSLLFRLPRIHAQVRGSSWSCRDRRWHATWA